jgi:hypothetical protein
MYMIYEKLEIETVLIIISGKEKHRMKKFTMLLAIIAFFSLSVSWSESRKLIFLNKKLMEVIVQ